MARLIGGRRCKNKPFYKPPKKRQYGSANFRDSNTRNGKVTTRKMTDEEKIKYFVI